LQPFHRSAPVLVAFNNNNNNSNNNSSNNNSKRLIKLSNRGTITPLIRSIHQVDIRA
jgi:hypothetical protein